MEDESDCFSVSLSNLLCRESEEECFNEELQEQEEDSFIRLSKAFASENEDEYVQMLIQRENTMFGIKIERCPNDSLLKSKDWLKCARLDAIEWILKVRGLLGFCFQTAYLSITYLDQFLSKRSIDMENTWAIRLLSIACLTLAAKMEECDVPLLSEFRTEEHCFENKVIQRMELLVLNTLEWRMASITPFAYLHYFITKLSDEYPLKDLASTSREHVLNIVKERNLMDERPSTIAAAAVLAASNKGLTRKTLELRISPLSICGGAIHNGEVFSCYNLMLELEMERTKTPKFVLLPDMPSIYSSSTDANSTSRNKRRRLTFQDFEKRV